MSTPTPCADASRQVAHSDRLEIYVPQAHWGGCDPSDLPDVPVYVAVKVGAKQCRRLSACITMQPAVGLCTVES